MVHAVVVIEYIFRLEVPVFFIIVAERLIGAAALREKDQRQKRQQCFTRCCFLNIDMPEQTYHNALFGITILYVSVISLLAYVACKHLQKYTLFGNGTK